MSTLSVQRIEDDVQPEYKKRSIWRDLPLDIWRDWHWQMRNRITSPEELNRVVSITPREQRTIERALDRFRFAVTPYFASLIDANDWPPREVYAVRSAQDLINNVTDSPWIGFGFSNTSRSG